jgi:hypothetical protein
MNTVRKQTGVVAYPFPSKNCTLALSLMLFDLFGKVNDIEGEKDCRCISASRTKSHSVERKLYGDEAGGEMTRTEKRS